MQVLIHENVVARIDSSGRIHIFSLVAVVLRLLAIAIVIVIVIILVIILVVVVITVVTAVLVLVFVIVVNHVLVIGGIIICTTINKIGRRPDLGRLAGNQREGRDQSYE